MSGLAFVVDVATDQALSLFERQELAELERGRLAIGDQGRFAVEPYRIGDAGSAERIRQIGGRLAAYTFG